MWKVKTIPTSLTMSLLAVSLSVSPVYAAQTPNRVMTPQGLATPVAKTGAEANANYSLVFPVNVAGKKVTLLVTIPPSFKPLTARQDFFEFIPKTDKDPFKWSEKITMQPLVGKKIPAKIYRDTLVNGTLKNSKSSEVIENRQQSFKDYEEASSIFQYQNNGRDEVALLYIVSGPYDLAAFQYALPLSSPKARAEVVAKLKNFQKDRLKVQTQ